jgi:hypothetical protein
MARPEMCDKGPKFNLVIYKQQQQMNCQKLAAEQTLPGTVGNTDLPSPLLGHSAPCKLGKKPRQNSSLRPSAFVVHPLGMFGRAAFEREHKKGEGWRVDAPEKRDAKKMQRN